MRFIVLSLLMFALPGCGSIPLSSMLKLSRFDPLNANAEQIRAAVRLPDNVRVKPGGAVMVLSARREAIGESLSDRFVLQRLADDDEQTGLDDERRPGFRIDIFRIAERDLPRLAELRQQIADWKRQDPDGTRGSLSIGIEGCRTGSLGAEELPVSTYLRTADDDGFFALTRNVDLRTIQPVADIPPCPSAAA